MFYLLSLVILNFANKMTTLGEGTNELLLARKTVEGVSYMIDSYLLTFDPYGEKNIIFLTFGNLAIEKVKNSYSNVSCVYIMLLEIGY